MPLRVEFTKFNHDEKSFFKPLCTANHQSSINIYIYIYKQRSHVGKHEVLPCSALYEDSFFFFEKPMKRVEILLSHIRDKNKFKNRDSLFLLVQCFKTFLIKK